MPRRPRLTWDEALARYDAHLRARRAAERTRQGHAYALVHLRDHTAPLRPDQVRLDDLRAYQTGLLDGSAARRGRPLSAGVVAREVSTLKAFFAFLGAEGRLAEDPARRLERPRLPRRLPGDVLAPAQVGRLLEAADPTAPLGLRDRALVEVLYAAALRRAEACALDLSDLDRAERTLHVRAGKGEKDRLLPLTRSAWRRLEDYLARARPRLETSHADSARALFLTGAGRRLHGQAVRRALGRLRTAAGLEARVTPHVLRRSAATHLMKGGVSLRHIQALLGHESLDTTAAYLRLDASELRRTLLLRHPRERLDP